MKTSSTHAGDVNARGNPRPAVRRRVARAIAGLAAPLLLAAGLAVGVAAPAGAETPTVWLTSDINYGGATVQLSSNVADLSTLGFNDRTSSIIVPAGTVVAAFDAWNFLGRCETFRVSDPDLRNNVVGNDTISSLWVGRPCPVLLFEANDYTGSVFSVSGDLPDFGLRFSNVMSSMRLQGNTVALFDQPNYGGLCENFTADDASFDNNPIRERASSLKFGYTCPQQAVLFSDINYGGDLLPVAVDGQWRNLSVLGWGNRVSSIYLSSGVYLDAANTYQVKKILGISQNIIETIRVPQTFTASNPDLRLSVIGNDTIDDVQAHQ